MCLHRILLITEGERVTSVEKPGRCCLHQEVNMGLIKETNPDRIVPGRKY